MIREEKSCPLSDSLTQQMLIEPLLCARCCSRAVVLRDLLCRCRRLLLFRVPGAVMSKGQVTVVM